MAACTTNEQATNILQASLGNLLVVCSSCFWTGPKRQLRSMWQELSRRLTSLVYCGSILTTLGLALLQPPLVSLYYFIIMIVQYVSTLVYALSYVPCVKTRMNNYLKRKMTGANNEGNMADTDKQQPNAEGVLV